MQSKEHKDKKYAWQLERDSDYTSATAFDSIEECIADAQDYFAEENVKIKSITIQELRPYEISVDAERVLEVVWEEAEANVGDLVDDWLDSRTAYTTEQLADLSERLTGVIKTWLEETHNEPDFFCIIGEKEISICDIPQ